MAGFGLPRVATTRLRRGCWPTAVVVLSLFNIIDNVVLTTLFPADIIKLLINCRQIRRIGKGTTVHTLCSPRQFISRAPACGGFTTAAGAAAPARGDRRRESL
jgi:hypothetical protein